LTTWFPYRKGISPFGFIHTYRTFPQKLYVDTPSELECLVFGVLRKMVQGSYMEFKLAALAEFPEACPETHEVWPDDGDGQPHRGLGDIKDPVLVKSEAVRLVGSVDQVNQVLSL
jgi:hypothetical protein